MISQKHIWRGLGALLVGTAMCGSQVAGAAALNLTDGDKIKLSWTGTYGHGSGGGEFKASGVSVLNGAGDSFLTFCLEYSEHISLDTAYFVKINTSAVEGGNGIAGTHLIAGGPAADASGPASPRSDPLSYATAWLYTQYRAGTLNSLVASYSYNDHSDANSLQKAIWFLENEKDLSFLDATAVALKDAAIGAGWTSLGKVRVMNLYSGYSLTGGFSGHKQDQLYLSPIPEPETYAMLLAGLGLLGFVARRRKQKSA